MNGRHLVHLHRIRTFLTPNKLYAFALGLFLVSLVCLFTKKPFGFLVISNAAGGVCGIGYILKIFEQAKNRWGLSYKKIWPVISNILLNGFVYLSSNIFAHHAVSKALELPVKDFGTTVQIVSIAFYLCAWLLIGLALFLPAFFVAVSTLLYHLAKSLLMLHLGSLADIFSFDSERWKSSDRASRKKAFILLGDVMGTISICLFLAFAFDKYRSSVDHHEIWIERIAYLVDYQPVMRYPNIDHTRRICLHDNGIVSYATMDQHGTVTIEVTKLSEQ
jgi:hypothetical protein